MSEEPSSEPSSEEGPVGPEVRVREVAERQRFEATVDGEVVGYLSYRRRPGSGALALTHTEVSDALRGRGLGTALVRAALDELGARGERVVPECDFVRAFVHDHPAYREVLASP